MKTNKLHIKPTHLIDLIHGFIQKKWDKIFFLLTFVFLFLLTKIFSKMCFKSFDFRKIEDK